MPAVTTKAQWALRYINAKDLPFAERLVAFACVEGILFSSSFCAIFYLRKRGFELPGLFQSNEYISRDEGLHCEFACHIHKKLPLRCSPDKILDIVCSAVEVEKVFVDSALSDDLLGMNRGLMFQYVQFVADVVLQLLNCPKHFKVANPFDFMTPISLSTKTNFFERRVTDYSIAEIAPCAAFTASNDDNDF
jgi:ribonucleotide reductase beta subunit family protein with ferritin-like domain